MINQKMKNLIILIPIVYLLISSCTEIIELDLNNENNNLTIYRCILIETNIVIYIKYLN